MDVVRLTTFASLRLPITLIPHQDADQLYTELLGSQLLVVPCGNEKRLKLWPGLKAAEAISFNGIGWHQSAIDIVLSSAGTFVNTISKFGFYIHFCIGRLGCCHG